MKSAAKARSIPKAGSTNVRPLRRAAALGDAPADIRDAISRLKRDSIVAAAVELFYKQGYARTTLEQVADAINVTKPFIYSHFRSKADLLAEICSRAIRLAHDSLNRNLGMQGTPTEKLEAIARDFMATVLSHQGHAMIYSREETELEPEAREAINTLRREFDRRLVEVLEAGVATGEFTVDDVPLAALSIGGIVGWGPVWYRPNGRLTLEEVADGVAQLVLNMVRAKAPRRKRTAAAR
ncbi:MAG TPA: TetR/AcrR family transcriptional regulator [Ramlibacter sp.]|nr:TetR/AcrR family transcriptional regulator [Ramlibacter sp.]